MAYELQETKIEESHLHYRLDGEAAERHGAIGYMRADFGDGREFWSNWFDNQPHLKTYAFKQEFESIIDSLRDDGQKSPLASRDNLTAFCAENQGVSEFTIRTLDYSYYFRFRPMRAHYDIYCFAYDNDYLLPEVAGQHDLPNDCFGIVPSSGELVFIVRGENGYYPSGKSTDDPVINRQIEVANNALLGVTRRQAEAMLAGSMFGWNTLAAKPWNYDQNGKPRQIHQPKKNEHER
jgi:hypothetical protein